MPQDDISALNAKMDFLIGTVKEQGEQLKEQSKQLSVLQRGFDQSKGALNLMRTAAWIAGIWATIWLAFHGMK